MLLLPLLALHAQAECPQDTTERALELAGAIELSFSTLDEDGYDDAAEGFQEAIACIRRELGAREVVRLHRAQAVVAFMERELEAARGSWAAVRTLMPGWEPSHAVAPPLHPLREAWDAAEPATETVPWPDPPPGGVVIDGRLGAEVPVGQAFVAQGFDDHGSIVHTGYHWSPDALPRFAPQPQESQPSADRPPVAGGPWVMLGPLAGWSAWSQRAQGDGFPSHDLGRPLLGGQVAGEWSSGGLGAAVDLHAGAGATGFDLDARAGVVARLADLRVYGGAGARSASVDAGSGPGGVYLPYPDLGVALVRGSDWTWDAAVHAGLTPALQRAHLRGGLSGPGAGLRWRVGLDARLARAFFIDTQGAQVSTAGWTAGLALGLVAGQRGE